LGIIIGQLKDRRVFEKQLRKNSNLRALNDVAGAVSDQELEAMVRLANELKGSTIAWLQEFHPELLKTE
jgi:hypothetical protein